MAPVPPTVPALAINETVPDAVPPVEIAPLIVRLPDDSVTEGALTGPDTVSVPPARCIVKPPPPETVKLPIVSIPAEPAVNDREPPLTVPVNVDMFLNGNEPVSV